MPIKQIPEVHWKEIADPFHVATLPFLPEEFGEKYNVTFEEGDDDGLGVVQFAFIEVDNTPYFLIVHLLGSEEAHYLTVSVRSFEPNSRLALQKLLATLELNEADLLWQSDQLGEAKWVLYRMDDYGNEAEVLRFHSQLSAEWIRKKYEDKGHKQMYFVRKIL